MGRPSTIPRRALLRWLLFLPPGHRHALWPGIVIAIVASVLNATCQHLGAYKRFEWADLDKLVQFADTGRSTPIVLVTIGDDDYADEQLFASRRPLNARTVIRLIRAACELAPAVVGVDIFTDTWTEEDRREFSLMPLGNCKVVWARDARPIESEPATFELGRASGSDADTACMGLAVLETSDDGVVREYRKNVLVRDVNSESSVATPYATLVTALASLGEACGIEANAQSETGEGRAKIRFSSNAEFRRLSAGVLLTAAEAPDGRIMQALRTHVVAGQTIVLIGGTFRDGRDVYMTPVGMMPGVEILAHAVATAQSGRPIREVSWQASLLLDLVVGCGLVWIVSKSRLRLLWGIALSTLVAVASTLIVCYALFSYLGYFLSVFVSAAGAVLGAIVDMTWHPMKNEFNAFRAEYRRLARRG